MDNEKIKILVVDDEADIRKIVRLLLEKKGYSVCEASNGQQAVEAAEKEMVDLIVMDIMMPNMSGVEAVTEIRKKSTVPVLFLTAKSLDRDKEAAYTSGGDDYLVKPFSSQELILRVESLLRRYIIYRGKPEDKDIIILPFGIEVNMTDKTVKKNGALLSLRDKEQEIFFYLLSRSGDTVDNNELYEDVWGEKAMASSANNVMVNILNLRKKLEDDPSNPKLIKTIWGKGYQLVR